MIEVSLTTVIMLYLCLTLLILLGLWTYQHYLTRHKKVIVSEQQLFLCEYCASAYVADSSRPVTRCPDCKSLNKDNLFKR